MLDDDFFADSSAQAGPIVEGLKAVRPTVFTGIPSIWNMLMDRGSGEKKLSNWARRKGLKGSMKLARGESPSWKFKLAEKKVGLGWSVCYLLAVRVSPRSRRRWVWTV